MVAGGADREVTPARLEPVRVVAGIARSRRLVTPDGDTTRPTADRVKEATFNALYSLGVIADSTVADLYAGSGAMGIEALSRGATAAVFVDWSREAIAAIETNLDATGFADQATVVRGDVLRHLANASRVDLALCDPPYTFDQWPELLAMIDAEVVVIESNRAVELPDRWSPVRVREYGTTVITIATDSP